MYKNYIFDFGKVIVEFEPAYMTAQYITDKDDCLLAQEVIFDRIYWDKLDRGTISETQVISAIKSRLPERLHKSAVEAYTNWYYHLPFIKGMPELIKDIKPQIAKRLGLNEDCTREEFYLAWTKNETLKKALNLSLLKDNTSAFVGESKVVKINGKNYAVSIYSKGDYESNI